MSKLIDKWSKIKSENRVIIVGNIALLIVFLAISFCFFIGQYSWPLGILLACPFANLNYFLYKSSIDDVLKTQGGKGRMRLDFLWRYLVLLIPVVASLILWYYSIYIFNPIAVGIAFIIYRIGIYLPITRTGENE